MKEKKKQLSLSLPVSVIEILEREAGRRLLPTNRYMTFILMDYIRRKNFDIDVNQLQAGSNEG